MEKVEKSIFEKIKDHIPQSLHPALLGEDIAEFIPHEDWEKAQAFLDEHQPGWALSLVRPLTPLEYLLVEKATVVKSQFGFSIEFTLKKGEPSYIPASIGLIEKVEEGNTLDTHDIRLACLYNNGKIIYRIASADEYEEPFLDLRKQLKAERDWRETKYSIWDKYLRPLRNIQYKKEGWSDGRLIFLDMVLY